jgi:hypothetical protein
MLPTSTCVTEAVKRTHPSSDATVAIAAVLPPRSARGVRREDVDSWVAERQQVLSPRR